MRIGCLFFPRFAVQVESGDNKTLSGKPVIIGGFPYESKAVYDASEEAARHGVKQGMPLRQAHILCPRGLFLPLDEHKYSGASTYILNLLVNYSPVVEAGAQNCVFIDATLEQDELSFIRGLVEIIEKESCFYLSIGTASNKFVAWVASQVARPHEPLIIPDGQERKFLQGLPVDLLPASFAVLKKLKLFGIYKMGELAELPCEAANLQFGADGQVLWELANGIDNSRLIHCGVPEIVKGELTFEPPSEKLELILNRADALLDGLSRQLKQRWQCCRQLTIFLSFTNDHVAQRALYFKEATSSKEVMLHQLKYCLEKASFTAPVSEMRLTLTGFCSEDGKQASFLDNPLGLREKLISTINQLQQRYGKQVVKKALPKEHCVLPEDVFYFSEFDS
jgi:DNA polymerase-4